MSTKQTNTNTTNNANKKANEPVGQTGFNVGATLKVQGTAFYEGVTVEVPTELKDDWKRNYFASK